MRVRTLTIAATAAFLWSAMVQSETEPAPGTQLIAAAWAASGAPIELKLYEGGGRGFDKQRPAGTANDRWLSDFADWLERNSTRTE